MKGKKEGKKKISIAVKISIKKKDTDLFADPSIFRITDLLCDVMISK